MSNAILESNEARADANEQWTVAHAEKNGRPLLIRYRSQRPQGVESAAFPLLLSATWSYQPNEHGLPSAEEMELMDKFEDALASSLERSQTAYLLVVLTNDGERDWLWYAGSEEQAMSQVNNALKGHKRYPVQFSVQKDRTWRAYSQFVDGDASQPASGGSFIGRTIAQAMQIFRRR